MTVIEPVFLNLAVALGIGFLIGAERERRKGSGPSRSPAGIRTFAVTALAGAISFLVGGETLLAIATAGIIALIAIAYWRGREDDPGLTTEIALPLSRATASRAGFAGALGLYRRARHRTVGAEYAAITRLRPQPLPAAGAFIKEPAGIGRHGFRFRGGAVRAGDGGFQDHSIS
jgi:hypothetical protein